MHFSSHFLCIHSYVPNLKFNDISVIYIKLIYMYFHKMHILTEIFQLKNSIEEILSVRFFHLKFSGYILTLTFKKLIYTNTRMCVTIIENYLNGQKHVRF